MNITEILPFLIPLAAAQFALLGYVLWHIFTHTNYKRGSSGLWVTVSIIGMQFIGPILYLLLGKEDS